VVWRVSQIKGLRGGVLKYAKPEIPQIDSEIAEKGHLWMETQLGSYSSPIARTNAALAKLKTTRALV
jgi:hypothetical protein